MPAWFLGGNISGRVYMNFCVLAFAKPQFFYLVKEDGKLWHLLTLTQIPRAADYLRKALAK